MDQILQGHVEGFRGMIMFRPWLRLLGWIGISGIGHEGLLPFYSVSFYTNVFTLFGPYVVDLSKTGALAFSLVAGLMSGYVYRMYKSNRTDPYFVLLHSLNLTVLSLSGFYDYYTTSAFTFVS